MRVSESNFDKTVSTATGSFLADVQSMKGVRNDQRFSHKHLPLSFSGSGSSRFRFVLEILPRCQVPQHAGFLT